MVRFGLKQGNEEIFVTVSDDRRMLDDLICDGYLDEDFTETWYYRHCEDIDYEDGEDHDSESKVIQAVCDWIDDQCERREDNCADEDPFMDESNQVIRAMYVIDDNSQWFCQFLSYNHRGF